MPLGRLETAAYVAGIFDGEGWVSLPSSRSGGCVGMGNTDEEIVRAYCDALDLLEIPHVVYHRDYQNGWKKLYIVQVSTRDAMQKFALLIPFRSPSKRAKLEDMNGRPRWRKDSPARIGMLRHFYCHEGKSQAECARLLGVGETAIRRWMKQYNIPRRTLSDAQSERQRKVS